MLQRDAAQKYLDAVQKENQSVRDFAHYLQQWESRLPVPYQEEHRKMHLRGKVLRVIREEALKYPNEPKSYDAFVAHLQKIEDTLPARWTARKNSKPNNNDKKGQAPAGQKPNSERSDRRSGKQRKKCSYCHRFGHEEAECRIKARDQEKKQGNNTYSSAQVPKN